MTVDARTVVEAGFATGTFHDRVSRREGFTVIAPAALSVVAAARAREWLTARGREWGEIKREGNEIVKRKKEFGGFKRHTLTVL